MKQRVFSGYRASISEISAGLRSGYVFQTEGRRGDGLVRTKAGSNSTQPR